MKFKTGCALAVLTLMCFQSSHGGVMKKMFSKGDAKENESTENNQLDVKENATPESQENKENKNTGDEGNTVEAEKPASTEAESTSADETKPAEQNASSEPSSTSAKSTDSNPIIAKVGNKSIRLNEVVELMKEIPPELLQKMPTDKLFPVIRKQLVDNMLLLDHAYKMGIDKKPEFTQQLEMLKKQLLYRFALQINVMPARQNEARLKSEYTAYLMEFKKQKEYSLHFAAFKDKKDAENMITALNKGGDFTKLMTEKSISSTAGIDITDRFIPFNAMPEFLQKAVKDMKKGEYSKAPAEAPDGYYVFKIVSVRDSEPLAFEKAKPFLEERVVRAETMKLLNRLYKQSNVKLFKEDGTPDSTDPAAMPSIR